MPFRLNPKRRVCVQVKRPSGWRDLKCHSSQVKAQAHLTALVLNVQEGTDWLCEHNYGIQEQGFDTSVPAFSMRKLLSNVNGKILDAILRHRHFVLRAENAVLKDLLRPLGEAEKQIKAEIARIAAGKNALTDFSIMRTADLHAMEALIARATQQAQQLTKGIAGVSLRDFGLKEFEIQQALLSRHIPAGISIDLGGGDLSRVLQIMSEPLGGKVWVDRIDKDFREMELAWRQDLATSFALGEGIDLAVDRLSLTTENVGRQRLTMIARTEMQRVANRAAMEQYERNRDVVKAVQIIETLDDRTCLICAVLDGQIRRLGSGDIPPFHPQCRGFITPVVMSLEEMGLNKDDFPPSVQSVLDGEPSDRVLYPEWFKGQSDGFQRSILGDSRFGLFKSGDLELTDFVDTVDLRILPVGQLAQMSLMP